MEHHSTKRPVTLFSDMEALEEKEERHSLNPEHLKKRTDENRQLDDCYAHISYVRRFRRSVQMITEMNSRY
jgi:hypothetical protein